MRVATRPNACHYVTEDAIPSNREQTPDSAGNSGATRTARDLIGHHQCEALPGQTEVRCHRGDIGELVAGEGYVQPEPGQGQPFRVGYTVAGAVLLQPQHGESGLGEVTGASQPVSRCSSDGDNGAFSCCRWLVEDAIVDEDARY